MSLSSMGHCASRRAAVRQACRSSAGKKNLSLRDILQYKNNDTHRFPRLAFWLLRFLVKQQVCGVLLESHVAPVHF